MSDNNKKSIVDIVDTVVELYEHNEEKIKEFMDYESGKVHLDEPLTEIHIDEEQVMLMAENVPGDSSFSVDETEYGVDISIGDEVIEAVLPDNTNVDSRVVTIKNQILTVKFDRGE